MECKKQERLSKDTCCSKYQDQRNSCIGSYRLKVNDGKVMKNLVEGVLNNIIISRLSFIGDGGAYESNDNSNI